MSKRETILPTSLFADDFKTLRIQIAVGVSLQVTVYSHRDDKVFGLTPGGWALLRDGFTEYVALETCPVCLDSIDTDLYPSGEPFLTLGCCGTKMHVSCAERMADAGGSGKMITFNHLTCPNCRTFYGDIPYGKQPPWPGKIADALSDAKSLQKTILRMTEARDLGLPKEERGNWAFFDCGQCRHPFCAGKISCAEEFDLDPSTLICDGCQWSQEAKDHRCFKHGKDYAIFKCDFCCNVASWACYSHHYCNYCHDHGGYQHPTPCPGGNKCPLGMAHPPPVQKDDINKYVVSFVIGCRKCQDPNCDIEYHSDNLDPFKLEQEKGYRMNNVVDLFDYRTKEPAKPIIEEPAKTIIVEPAKPIIEEPAKPIIEEPAKPIIEEPAKPIIQRIATDDAPKVVDILSFTSDEEEESADLPSIFQLSESEDEELLDEEINLKKQESAFDLPFILKPLIPMMTPAISA